MHANRKTRTRGDDGFTLVEVIVSLVMLSIVLTASISFIIQANITSAYQQHNQVAVTIAGQAMERVSATTPNATVLVEGRLAASVTAAWTANASRDGVGDTYPLSDTTATPSSVPRIPITETQTFSGTDFATTTLIGSCYRLRADVTDTECAKLTGFGSAPATTPAGYVRLLRTIVIVTWVSDDECPGGCSYQTASYTDVSTDLEWNG